MTDQPSTQERYRIHRVWLLPFIVEVWEHRPTPDWQGRTYWWRIGSFGRRSTAERFIDWRRSHD